MCPVRIVRSSLTFLLLASPLSAAVLTPQSQQGQTGQDTTQAPAPPAPIPTAEIPQRADAVNSTLRALQDRLAPTDAVMAVAAALPGFTDTLSRVLEDPTYRPSEGASLRTLDGIRRRWVPFQERLAAWKGTLETRSQRLAVGRDSLLLTRQLWERTRAAAAEEEAPQALLDRTTSLLSAIDDTDIRLRARLDTVLSVLDDVLGRQRAIDEILIQVDSAEAAARGRLFEPDSPPLWRAMLAGEDTLSLAGQARVSWDETRLDWISYTRDSRADVAVVLAVFAVVLALLFALKRQTREWGESRQWPVASAELDGTSRILARPVSAAMLLAVLVWRLGLPDPPASVRAVVMIVLVVPVLRLLPTSIARDLRKPLYGLAVLWVLGELVVLALDGSLLQRLVLLVTAFLTGSGLYWAVRRDGPIRALATNRWWKAALVAGRLGIVVMVASIVANVAGRVSLAEVLARATMVSAAAALVLATVGAILDGLIWTILRTDWAQTLRSIRGHSETLTRRLVMLAHVGVLLLWFGVVLKQFGIERPVREALARALGSDLAIGTFAISLGDILGFVIVIWISLVLARGIRTILEADVLERVSLPRGVPAAISTMVYYAAVFIGFLMAASAAGFDLSRFTLLAGAFGVGLGFGLQNVVNNFVSGLILIFERPIQVGDVVEVGGIQGRIKGIGIRASTVRTWSGAEVIVPNGDLISQQVTNWTLSDRLRRMEIPVGVRYGTDPRRVIDLLTETITQHPDVLSDPRPSVLFKGFGESSLDFVARAWTSSEDWWLVNSDLAVAVNDALKEAKIEIPFPQRDLHVRSVNPDVKLGG